MSAVIVQDLYKAYGALEAVRGVSFEVAAGEIFGLLGPNGAGKTTTIECLLGLRQADRGYVEVCGIDALRQPRRLKEQIGAVLQTTELHERITPREALRLFGTFYRRHGTPEDLLERFRLADQADAAFDTLSGGQRRRVMLALAFVHEPKVVFLDEPTTGLDPQSRRDLYGEIRAMREEGRTVLLTTHYIEEAQALCNRVAIIHQGQIIAEGAPRELIASAGAATTIEVETSDPIPAEVFVDAEGVIDVESKGRSARLRVRNVHRALTDVTRRLEHHGLVIAELHVQAATLEDVFIRLTGSSIGEFNRSNAPREAETDA